MSDDDALAAYRRHLDDVRTVLAQNRRWHEMPRLLEELNRERARIADWRLEREQVWVGRFASAAGKLAANAEPERVREVAHKLWPWLGWYEPEAIGAGRWDRLPRSHA